jgi:hypothetical protein
VGYNFRGRGDDDSIGRGTTVMVTLIECDGCGAEVGEECRWSCLSWEEIRNEAD